MTLSPNLDCGFAYLLIGQNFPGPPERMGETHRLPAKRAVTVVSDVIAVYRGCSGDGREICGILRDKPTSTCFIELISSAGGFEFVTKSLTNTL